ncbi:uncharacterized protein LOC143297956 [Babylonia areolata]|uniref:uncharacterized protein LOC143297956 n=1 Tax=Babylonia areolata TaxID=304850 RepID=UPI003FD61613
MSLSAKDKEPTEAETSPKGENAAATEENVTTVKEKENTVNEDEKDKDNREEDENRDGVNEEEEEIKDTEDDDDEEEKEQEEQEKKEEAFTIDLSRMKTLYQFRSRPTLPYLLTEYGMEDKEALPVKKKEKEKKKKKRRSFGDDGRDKEREKQVEERQLQVLEDMKKLRDYYYDEYTTLLQNRVEQQRHDIRQHSRLQQNKLARQEELRKQERNRVIRKFERHELVSDNAFLEDLPKSDLFYITQLQDRLRREGTLKSQTDCDIFWERIQQPDIFYMYFKVPKSDDPTVRDDFNENASSMGTSTWKGSASTLRSMGLHGDHSPPPAGPSKGGPRALSRIAESRESSRPGTRTGHHWAITQQFPAQNREPRDKRRSSFTGLKQPAAPPKSTYLQDLEKRFPKLEMPKLHCFTMNLGPNTPDPEEVRQQMNLRELEKVRKNYTVQLTRMHQLAMANTAAARRILEMHDDMDFIINGAPLKDLISDQHFYSELPPRHPPRARGDRDRDREEGGPPSSSSPVQGRELEVNATLPSALEHEERAVSSIHSSKGSSAKSGSGKSRGKKKTGSTPRKSVTEELVQPSPVGPVGPVGPVPLSLSEVVDNTRIVEAKCLSTKWTNYMKDAPPVKT